MTIRPRVRVDASQGSPRPKSGASEDLSTDRVCDCRFGISYKEEGWGGRRDSNPQQPESQSGDLPLIYDHHPKSAAKLVSAAECVKPRSRPSHSLAALR